MYLDLDIVKKHLNLESSFTEDDEYILGLMDTAESAVEVHLNGDLETYAEENGGCLPPAIYQAALLMVGNLYQNREIVGTSKATMLPFNYRYLLDLYRHY